MAFVTTVSSSSKGSLPLLISYSPRSFKKIPPFYTYIHVADAFFGIKCTNMLVQTPVYMKKFPNQNISSKNRRIHILFFQVHMLGHKTSLSKFKKTKITSSRFSGQEGMELEIKCKKQVLEKHKHVEKEWVNKKKKSKRKLKKIQRQMKMGTPGFKIFGMQQRKLIGIQAYFKKKAKSLK